MLVLALLLTASGFAAEVAAPKAPAAPSLIIVPETSKTAQAQQPPALVLPPGLIAPAPAALVAPDGSPLQAPTGLVAPDGRPLREAARGPLVAPATEDDLSHLTGSLAKPAPAQQAANLQNAFDGTRAPEAADWDEVRRPNEYFASGSHAPDLPVVAAAARSIYQRLLPRLYKPLAVKAAYTNDSKTGPGAAHYWSAEEGHVIEFTPAETDKQGMVQSAIGGNPDLDIPGPVVQQKIEQLVQYLHEFSHGLFDAAVGKEASHFPDSTHAAMTEGFAVTAERLLVENLLTNAASMGLSPQDALDLRRLHEARQKWLREQDTAYSEGEPVWRRAFEASGEEGLASLLSSLSWRRLIDVRRGDPTYQLSLESDDMIRAYLGKDGRSPLRLGLDAYAKAARGEALSAEESALASTIAAQAGPKGWRHVFDRVISRADLFQTVAGDFWIVPAWLRPYDTVTPAFALAALDPQANAELAHYLADAARSPNGLTRIFEKEGPSPRLFEVMSHADGLSWTPEDRAAWDAAVASWLAKTPIKPLGS